MLAINHSHGGTHSRKGVVSRKLASYEFHFWLGILGYSVSCIRYRSQSEITIRTTETIEQKSAQLAGKKLKHTEGIQGTD